MAETSETQGIIRLDLDLLKNNDLIKIITQLKLDKADQADSLLTLNAQIDVLNTKNKGQANDLLTLQASVNLQNSDKDLLNAKVSLLTSDKEIL